jgi:uncharacterized protein YjbJ (UPF0337 family)
MNKDQVKGRIDEAKGRVKQTAGKVLGDKTLEAQGSVEKNFGRARAIYGDMKENVKKKN